MKLQTLIHVLIGIICVGLLPGAQAVSPPPDGGYPGGNTAEGQNALGFTGGGYNTAVGFYSLAANSSAYNTGVGAGAHGGSRDLPAQSLATSPAVSRALVADFGTGDASFVLQNASTHQTKAWFLEKTGSKLKWKCLDDFTSDGFPSYALFNASTRHTAVPIIPSGWEFAAKGDFSRNGTADYVLSNPSTGDTAVWYFNNTAGDENQTGNIIFVGAAAGPTLPDGWSLISVADFDGDGQLDYALFNRVTRQTEIWYLNGTTFIGSSPAPTILSGWELVATADFDGDDHPDYLLYNASTRQTKVWYLNVNIQVGGANGPTIPWGWSLVAPSETDPATLGEVGAARPTDTSAAVRERLETMKQTAPAHEQSEVEFTAADINAMIAANPKSWGTASVEIDGNVLHVQLSIPLARLDFPFRRAFRLRWLLNATVTIVAPPGTNASTVQLSEVKLNGRRVPSALLDTPLLARGPSLRRYVIKYADQYGVTSGEIRDGKVILHISGH